MEPSRETSSLLIKLRLVTFWRLMGSPAMSSSEMMPSDQMSTYQAWSSMLMYSISLRSNFSFF